MAAQFEPYVPASKSIAEITVQAVLLGLVLSFVMCAANIYVGLYAGMTVSAAIPASVISMGILRGVLRRGTVLENNIVHTIASSGESLAAGIIFTVPALVLLGVWTTGFNYWETTLIAMAGGVMGVTMMIPLRKAMIIDQPELRFPEGVACAEVLKAGDRGGAEMRGIFGALGIGALFKILVSVCGLLLGSVERGFKVSKTAIYGGIDISPMLMGVGFIVGYEVSMLIFVGGAISYMAAIPVLAWGGDFTAAGATDFVNTIWDQQIRYFGIGAMVVGGAYSIIKVAGSIRQGVVAAFHGIRGTHDDANLPRTEQNITGRWLGLLIVACVALTAVVYQAMTHDLSTTLVTTLAMVVLAFFFVAVASYIAGLVGSSNSPVSGMTICTVLITSGLLLMLGFTGAEGMLATLGVAGVVCCAACTSGDICQDLKIGQILGATPRRQQWAEVLGTALPAFIIAPTMTLLHRAYGIGEAAREGVAPLKAPQAMMFKELVGTLFGDKPLPWILVGAGAAVGVAAILIDRVVLEPRNTKFRLHVMPLAVGMYLPWTVTTPILLGGVVYRLVERSAARRGAGEEEVGKIVHRGLLFSSGLVAGEAIMGIVIAGLVIVDLPLPLLSEWAPHGVLQLVSLAALGFMAWLLSRKALGSRAA
jgi:putative OPT family oligopeptide transporter